MFVRRAESQDIENGERKERTSCPNSVASSCDILSILSMQYMIELTRTHSSPKVCVSYEGGGPAAAASVVVGRSKMADSSTSWDLARRFIFEDLPLPTDPQGCCQK
jgi:hypothetical protein